MPKEFDPDEFKLDVHSIPRRGNPQKQVAQFPGVFTAAKQPLMRHVKASENVDTLVQLKPPRKRFLIGLPSWLAERGAGL